MQEQFNLQAANELAARLRTIQGLTDVRTDNFLGEVEVTFEFNGESASIKYNKDKNCYDLDVDFYTIISARKPLGVFAQIKSVNELQKKLDDERAAWDALFSDISDDAPVENTISDDQPSKKAGLQIENVNGVTTVTLTFDRELNKYEKKKITNVLRPFLDDKEAFETSFQFCPYGVYITGDAESGFIRAPKETLFKNYESKKYFATVEGEMVEAKRGVCYSFENSTKKYYKEIPEGQQVGGLFFRNKPDYKFAKIARKMNKQMEKKKS